jgi:hypothetical protein
MILEELSDKVIVTVVSPLGRMMTEIVVILADVGFTIFLKCIY